MKADEKVDSMLRKIISKNEIQYIMESPSYEDEELSNIERGIKRRYGNLGLQIYDLIDDQRTVGAIAHKTGLSIVRINEIMWFFDLNNIIWIDDISACPPIWLTARHALLGQIVRQRFGKDGEALLEMIDGKNTWEDILAKTRLQPEKIFVLIEFCERQIIETFLKSNPSKLRCAHTFQVAKTSENVLESIREQQYFFRTSDLEAMISDLEEQAAFYFKYRNMRVMEYEKLLFNLGTCCLLNSDYYKSYKYFKCMKIKVLNYTGFAAELLGFEDLAAANYAKFLEKNNDKNIHERFEICKKKQRGRIQLEGPVFRLKKDINLDFAVPRRVYMTILGDDINRGLDRTLHEYLHITMETRRKLDTKLVEAVNDGKIDFPLMSKN